MSTSLTQRQRLAAYECAGRAVLAFSAVVAAVRPSLERSAAARLDAAAEGASVAVRRLGTGTGTDHDLRPGLASVIILGDVADEVSHQLPLALAELLMTAAIDVLDPVIDLSTLGLGWPPTREERYR